MKKRVTVKYFAKYREMTGVDEETIFTESERIGSLLDEIRRRHVALSSENNILVSKNQNYADPESRIDDGDEVGILPPVSGG